MTQVLHACPINDVDPDCPVRMYAVCTAVHFRLLVSVASQTESIWLAGLGARRALTQWYRFGRGRRNNGRRGGRDYYR